MGVITGAQGVQKTYKLTFILELSSRSGGVPFKQGTTGPGQGQERLQLDDTKSKAIYATEQGKASLTVNSYCNIIL